jgi:hypothetical protein
LPRRRALHVPRAVLDRVPIDQPGSTSVFDDNAKPLIFGHVITDRLPGYELVEELSQSEGEAARLIFSDDRVRLLDQGQRFFVKLDGLEGLAGHRALPATDRLGALRAA